MDDTAFTELSDVDSDIGVADNALLNPGSDGLITGRGPEILMQMAQRRDQGASIAQLRRDTAMSGQFDVTDSMIDRAASQGARLREYTDTGRISETRRFWGGHNLPSQAEFDARQGVSL